MSSDDSDYDYNTEEPIGGWGDGGGDSGSEWGARSGGDGCERKLPDKETEQNPLHLKISEAAELSLLLTEANKPPEAWFDPEEKRKEGATSESSEVWKICTLFETVEKLQGDVTALKKQVELLEKKVFPSE